jgi:hypothetical protein
MGWSKWVRGIAKPFLKSALQPKHFIKGSLDLTQGLAMRDIKKGFRKNQNVQRDKEKDIANKKVADTITGQQAQTDAWGAEPTSIPED